MNTTVTWIDLDGITKTEVVHSIDDLHRMIHELRQLGIKHITVGGN